MTQVAPPSPEPILQTALAFFASKTLLSAVELELFTELAKHPEDLATLQGRLGLHPRSAQDFFDALVAMKLLERRDGKYYNSAAADFYLDKRKPSYLGGFLAMANRRLYPFWGHLTTALRTGQPQNEAKDGGPDPFAAIYADPATLKEFLKAMTGGSRGANLTIARKFPFAGYKTVVDVGTAQGDLITQIALANPHIQGIGFDLAEVGPVFDDYVEQCGVADRVKFAAGSFFDSPLPKADVVVMGHILHDWDLDVKRMLVKKAYDAVPEGGAFIAYDMMIDDDRSANVMGFMMSLNMLIETPGGSDYTGADCIGWMQEAGFRETRVEPLVGPHSMAIGIK